MSCDSTEPRRDPRAGILARLGPAPCHPHRDRTGTLPRCRRCGLHERLCLCAELQPLALATRVVIVRTAREAPQPTNTGRLVPLVLADASLLARDPAQPLAREELAAPGRRTLLLFPEPGAPELAPEAALEHPVTLVVPDGTWRAARRMATREPALAELERVSLPAGPPSRYRLRSHPDRACLATFESVARALGILEGPAVRARLEHLFALFVDRTLYSRGRLRAALVTGGVPPRAAYSARADTRAEPSSS
ncbi:MAG TPA: tRNA-uridine aminocarboxypropyltransferase [Planctomycetota bacterium]